MRRLAALLIALLSSTTTAAQSPNWSAVDAEALRTLQSDIGPAILIIDDALVETARKR